MTNSTGTAPDLEGLLSSFDTFATGTPGWTAGYSPNPDTTNRWLELHKSNISFSCRYDTTPLHLSIHHAITFLNSSTAPGDHTNDSGNGYNTTGSTANANLLTERCVRDIGDGPFPSYHFFADTAGTYDYVHAAVQVTPGMYRHFGFGILDKFNDFTGGEYVYGHYMNTGTSRAGVDPSHTTMLDGVSTQPVYDATIRIADAGLLNRGSSNFGICGIPGAPGNDNDGTIRRRTPGGYRAGGLEMRAFGSTVGNSSSGFISMAPIPVYYKDPSNPRFQLLGWQPDVRQFNIRNFEPGQEITFDGDTWTLFPMSIKTTALIENRSQYLGIAYKKVA